MFQLKCNLPGKLVCTQIQDYNYCYRMLLTGELSLDGKASLLLCPFYLERKAAMKAANILMSASFVFFFFLAETPLIFMLPEMFALAMFFFFVADQLFIHKL